MKILFVLSLGFAALVAAPAPAHAGLLNLFSGNRSEKKMKKTSVRQSNRGNNGDVNVVVNGNGNTVNVDRSHHNHNTTVVNRTTVVAAPTMSGHASRGVQFTGGGRQSSCTPGDPECRRMMAAPAPVCPDGRPAQLLGYRLPDGRFVRELPPGMRVAPPVFVNGGGAPAPRQSAPRLVPRSYPPRPVSHGHPMAAGHGQGMRHPSGSWHPNGYYTVWWAR